MSTYDDLVVMPRFMRILLLSFRETAWTEIHLWAFLGCAFDPHCVSDIRAT